MDRRAARINRTGLTLVGLLLLAGGGAALARALGTWGSGSAADPLLADSLRRYPDGQSWFWPAVAAGAVVVTLLGLAWLFAQGRTEKLPGLSLEPDRSEGSTRVASRAVTEAIEADVNALPGVRKARARLLGSQRHPRLMLTMTYGTRADLAALRGHIADEAVTRLRTALEVDSLPTVVRLRLVSGEERRSLA